MSLAIFALLVVLYNTGRVASQPKMSTAQACVSSSVEFHSINMLSNFHLNVTSQSSSKESFVLNLIPSSDRLLPTLSTLQTNPPAFDLNQGIITYKDKVFGRSRIEDKSLLPKALFFLDKKEAQQANFEAVFICDEQGTRRRILRGTMNSDGKEPDVIIAIERAVGGMLFVPLHEQQSEFSHRWALVNRF